MSTTTATRQIKRVEKTGKQAARSPWVDRLTRIGYAARGVLYILIGLLALQFALGTGGAPANQNGVLAMLSGIPFGNIILIGMAIGLAGYSLWGVVRALFDPLNRGDDPVGLIERASFVISAISYGAFALVALYFASGWGIRAASQPPDISAQLMSKPYGRWLTAGFGAFWLASALAQVYIAVTAKFARDFKFGKDDTEREWAILMGRIGYAARGVVFGIIGWFLIQAAYYFDPNQAVGFDGALLELVKNTYGTLLMGAVALGLVAFGIYSVLCARWIRTGARKHG